MVLVALVAFVVFGAAEVSASAVFTFNWPFPPFLSSASKVLSQPPKHGLLFEAAQCISQQFQPPRSKNTDKRLNP